jgi:8-oxo-dGTP pyrophosphatase MutT (NUDIX family)
VDGERVLFLKRSPRVAFRPGWWNLPSGRIEPQDGSLEEAARRELREETGLTAETLELLGTDDRHHGVFFACRVFSGRLVTNWESCDQRWLGWDDVTFDAAEGTAALSAAAEQPILLSHAAAVRRLLRGSSTAGSGPPAGVG